jgi:hypothetical protein
MLPIVVGFLHDEPPCWRGTVARSLASYWLATRRVPARVHLPTVTQYKYGKLARVSLLPCGWNATLVADKPPIEAVYRPPLPSRQWRSALPASASQALASSRYRSLISGIFLYFSASSRSSSARLRYASVSGICNEAMDSQSVFSLGCTGLIQGPLRNGRYAILGNAETKRLLAQRIRRP